MICSSVNLLFLMSAILLVGGLLLRQLGTAGGEQVSWDAWTVTLFGVGAWYLLLAWTKSSVDAEDAFIDHGCRRRLKQVTVVVDVRPVSCDEVLWIAA